MAFKHIGKKVEISNTRIDNDLFLERTITVSAGKMNVSLVAPNGKVLPSNVSAFVSVLGDNNDAITTNDSVSYTHLTLPTTQYV